jgi:RHS repeat-associated protein
VKRVKGGKVAVGHPVDVATGTLFHEFKDHTLQGRAPLVFARRYSTALIHRTGGMFGAGWSSPFEMRIRTDLDGYRLLAEDGETEIPFEDHGDVLKSGGTVRSLGAFHELRREKDRLMVTRWDPEVQDVVRFLFRIGRDGEWWPLISRQDVTGYGIDIEHDEAGRIVALRQRREGRGYRLVYSREGRLLEVYVTPRDGSRTRPTLAGGRLVLRYGYDGKGRLAECTDALGQHSSYTYDAEGRMTREVNRAGMAYRFRYDTKGRCVETTGPDDFGLEALRFDDVARITRVSNSLGQVTAYHCNTAGQVETEVSPLGNVTARVYDAEGRLCQVIMPGGATRTRAYDARGDLVQITSPGGMTTTYEYNDDHQVICVIDPAGNRWPRQLDRSGRLTAVTNPLGETASYHYNAEGDLVAIVNPAGHRRRFEWDAEGNLTGATDWVGNRTTYAYDAEGRLIAMVDPLGQKTTATLDALGRSREVTLPDGAVRKYGWNAYGQLTAYVAERGAAHRWRYAPCGLLAEAFHPEGGLARLEWGTVPGQLLAVRNAQGERFTYEYDEDGRVIAETDFAGATTRYLYDAHGSFAAVERPDGRRVHFTRNAEGAVTHLRYDDGAQTSYEYDNRGLLVKVDNGDCAVEREYDAVGRLVREKQGAHEVFSDYDAAGNRVRRHSSRGHETAFQWDGNGKLTQLRPSGLEAIRFEYDARSDELARQVLGGVKINQRYDSRGYGTEQRVIVRFNTSWAHGSNWPIHRHYEYDAAGDLTATLDEHRGTTRNEYDLAGRLTTAHAADGFVEQFSYDPAGNVTSAARRGGGPPVACQYGPGNRLIERDGARYEYDRAGRLVRKIHRGEETCYTWNSQGLLAGITLPGGAKWTYHYDAFGRRVRKCGPAQAVEFIWDGDVVLHELRSDAAGEVQVIDWQFDPDGFAPIAKVEGGAQYLCVDDPAGAPRELLDTNGGPVWGAQFTVFGERRESRFATVDCPVRFQGQWYDAETGLHYNRFRYYDPVAGRYISPDPLGPVAGWNAYTYGPNTTGWVDPLGLTDQPCWKTYSNKYPEDEVKIVLLLRLEFRNGKWRTIGPGETEFTARGKYIFVRQGDDLFVAKAPKDTGSPRPNQAGHIDLARGWDVDYAGEIQFGRGTGRRGQIQWWDNGSGHYEPEAEYAHQAGFPMDLFKPYKPPPIAF